MDTGVNVSHPADAATAATLAAVQRFNDAFNRHDVAGIMAGMTDDCVFDNTRPAPDGQRFEGQAAVRPFRSVRSQERLVFQMSLYAVAVAQVTEAGQRNAQNGTTLAQVAAFGHLELLCCMHDQQGDPIYLVRNPLERP